MALSASESIHITLKLPNLSALPRSQKKPLAGNLTGANPIASSLQSITEDGRPEIVTLNITRCLQHLASPAALLVRPSSLPLPDIQWELGPAI